MINPMELTGKRIMVTGASSGIGRTKQTERFSMIHAEMQTSLKTTETENIKDCNR